MRAFSLCLCLCLCACVRTKYVRACTFARSSVLVLFSHSFTDLNEMLWTRSHITGHAGTRKKLSMLCVKSKQTYSFEGNLKQTKEPNVKRRAQTLIRLFKSFSPALCRRRYKTHDWNFLRFIFPSSSLLLRMNCACSNKQNISISRYFCLCECVCFMHSLTQPPNICT